MMTDAELKDKLLEWALEMKRKAEEVKGLADEDDSPCCSCDRFGVEYDEGNPYEGERPSCTRGCWGILKDLGCYHEPRACKVAARILPEDVVVALRERVDEVKE
jgi:hypothetical protein